METGTTQANTGNASGNAAGTTGATGTSESTLLTPSPQSTNAGTDAKAQGQTSNGTQAGATQGQQPGATGAQTSQGQTAAEIELKFPEGFQADSEAVNAFKGLAKEWGLKSESAQKLADLYVKSQESLAGKLKDSWESQQKTWQEATKSDKEFGGQAFEQNQQIALKAMKRFSTPELTQYLRESGAGNHPEMVRFVYRVGKALAEDTVSGTGAGPGGAASGEEAKLRAMFPTHYETPKAG